MDKAKLSKEKELVDKAKRDSGKFAKLYKKYNKKVKNFIRKKVNNESLAEDLTSKVFEKALNKIDSFQWQGVSFGCWIFKIARNTVYDFYRSQRNNKLSNLDDDTGFIPDKRTNLEKDVLHDESELELYSVISELDEEDQYLLYYKYFEGLSNKKIAKKTGLSVSNVGTKLFRIRKKMKELFDDIPWM